MYFRLYICGMTMILVRICLVMLATLMVHCENGQKRILLHNEQDVVAEITTLKSEISSLKQQVQQLTSRQDTLGSESTYIRWGRTVCPGNNTTIVYSGFAAGSFYSRSGGAADFLCLTSDPIWDRYDNAQHSYTAKIYGAEYQFGNSYSDGGASFFDQDLFQHDAPCAVCQTRGTVLMIPGRNQCYPGWTKEYSGYLATGRHSDSSASNYICLDSKAETEFGDSRSEDGKLINLVEAVCGSLKCPPYVQYREITCVVCSK